MLCYLDRTFCSNAEECVNAISCHRHFTDDLLQSSFVWAKEFWQQYAPVAMAEFKNVCANYKERHNDHSNKSSN